MRLRKRLYDNYPRTGSPDKIEFAEFLFIDTDMRNWVPKGGTEEEYTPVQPGAGEYVNCQISKTQFDSAFDAVEYKTDSTFSAWLKPEMQRHGHKSVIHGAGTHRQFGRMAFIWNASDIRQKLEKKIDRVLQFAASTPADVLCPGGSVTPNVLEIVIIASLSGGTGAGMLIDASYLVKDILSSPQYADLEYDYTSLIAFLPRIFADDVKDANMFTKLKQNACAALLELEYYGTPRSGDEMFLGQDTTDRRFRNEVAFFAPWKSAPTEEGKNIRGPGWGACYLIDNSNPAASFRTLDASETYQMTADYLFLDLENSAFGVSKRSTRATLAQFQGALIRTSVRRGQRTGTDADDVAQSVIKGRDILYQTHNGCTFSSFGLAEITFEEARVYRASAYRLAANLVRRKWLGNADSTPKSQYNSWTTQDLFQPGANKPSFMPDSLVGTLYHSEDADWLQKAKRDMEAIRQVPPHEGLARLRDYVRVHTANLSVETDHQGPAVVTRDGRAKDLRGTPTELGTLRGRMRHLAREKAHAHGIAVTLQTLVTYRRGLQEAANKAHDFKQRKLDNSQSLLARLEEAGRVPPPVRSTAQRIEFPRACDASENYVSLLYNRCGSDNLAATINSVRAYVGDAKEAPPKSLDKLRTLNAYFKEAEGFLESLCVELDQRFKLSRETTGSDRKQSLFPENWDDEAYDDLIEKALISNDRIGEAPGRNDSLNWDKLQREVLDVLHQSRSELGEIRTFPDLLDYFFDHKKTRESGVKESAEMVAAACYSILRECEINLDAFEDGSVVDLLKTYDQHDLDKKLEGLVAASFPYFPLNAERQVTNHRLASHSLFGRKPGDNPKVSSHNVEDIVKQVNRLAADAKGQTNDELQSLEGSRSSLVVCREVWGIPLQYYRFLDDLHESYHQANSPGNRGIDECHINYNEAWEDLPDIREISAETKALIRQNTENVLFAMLIGTIKSTRENAFNVEVKDSHGRYDNIRLGKRINRVIKHACEQPDVRAHLAKVRETWEAREGRDPRKWAILLVSAGRTYDVASPEIILGTDKYSPPLRNCFDQLFSRIKRELSRTEEGRRWLDYLSPPDRHLLDLPDYERELAAYNSLIGQIFDEHAILHQINENIPIFQVDWHVLEKLVLPDEGVTDAPTDGAPTDDSPRDIDPPTPETGDSSP